MNNFEMVETALADLAAKPSIAAHLSSLGIKGTKQDIYACPIYRFLKFLGLAVVYTGPDRICLPNPEDPKGRLYLDTPASIQEFMHHFDAGWYPELVDPERPERPGMNL